MYDSKIFRNAINQTSWIIYVNNICKILCEMARNKNILTHLSYLIPFPPRFPFEVEEYFLMCTMLWNVSLNEVPMK